MRNYSHFIVDGEWIPLSKADKGRMKEFLLSGSFPQLAAIAESGQKHIVFRAIRNPPGSEDGWVQFEEQRIFVERKELMMILGLVEALYEGFSKDEIERGNYAAYRIEKFGIEQWMNLEEELKKWRGRQIFYLALFLAQRKDMDDGSTESKGASRGYFDGNLEGDTGGLQEPLSDEYLGAVRKSSGERGIYEQSSKVYQYSLFEAGGGDRNESGGTPGCQSGIGGGE